MHHTGLLYRALNPIYAKEPMSGRGAEIHGGRFNPKGTAALYTSLALPTAIREANQVGDLQPTTIVSYNADIDGIFDCRDLKALAGEGMTPADLTADTWRDEMKSHGIAKTQEFARALKAAGFPGILVRSFQPGTTNDDLNLVLWTWGPDAPTKLTLIDDENRLGRP
jgi:RES domain-containing protein